MVRQLSSLRGSSAEALQTLGDLVQSDRRTLADFSELGPELFRLAALLRSEPSLRRALTDVSAPAESKAALVQGLLEGKVAAGTLEVATTAVGLRWVAARDLPDALEHLGVVATVRGAGAREAERLADELFVVASTVEQQDELRHALADPIRTPQDKADLLRGLLEGRALPATVALVEQGLQGSFRSFDAAISEYQKVAADVVGESVALVRTARELSAAEESRLTETLSDHYARPVHLNVQIDPDLIGGLRVEIGDDVIDGTVASRLDDARRRIAG